MTAKEFLSKAYQLDVEINNKIEIMESMHAIATKATATFSQVPPSGTRDVHQLEGTLAKILDTDIELSRMLKRLVDLKAEILLAINEVENQECRLLLEMRYLRFMTWEQIAAELNYNVRHVYRVHYEALAMVKVPA